MGQDSAPFLREAGFSPIPRWWIRKEQIDIVKSMAEECSEEVNLIRKNANSDNRNPRPEFLKKTERLEHELSQAKKALEEASSEGCEKLQATIDRMWHVINDKMLRDEDKMDIIYNELHRSRK